MGESLQHKAKRILKAAKNGNPKAQYNAGIIYLKGLGVVKDTVKALEWLEKSKKNSYDEAFFTAGYIYYHGLAEKKEPYRALNDFIISAKNGKSEAFEYINKIDNEVKIYEGQKKKIIDLYTPLAKEGDKQKQKWLATYYYHKNDFVSKLKFRYWDKRYNNEKNFNLKEILSIISEKKSEKNSNEKIDERENSFSEEKSSKRENTRNEKRSEEKESHKGAQSNKEQKITSNHIENHKETKESHDLRDSMIVLFFIILIAIFGYKIGNAVFFSGETKKSGEIGNNADSKSSMNSTVENKDKEKKLVIHDNIVENMKEYYLINKIIFGVSTDNLVDLEDFKNELPRDEYTREIADDFFINGILITNKIYSKVINSINVEFLKDSTNYFFANINFTEKPYVYKYEFSMLEQLVQQEEIFSKFENRNEEEKEQFSIFYFYIIEKYGYETFNQIMSKIITEEKYIDSLETILGKSINQIKEEFQEWANNQITNAKITNEVFLSKNLNQWDLNNN